MFGGKGSDFLPGIDATAVVKEVKRDVNKNFLLVSGAGSFAETSICAVEGSVCC
ncbi:hypothetical protein D3C83_322740 [compost metagenome]